MWVAALPATLAAVVLFYLSDRQQRWLDRPLPGVARLLALLLALAGAVLWVMALGLGVGLMVALWLLTLPALLMALFAGHHRDTFQKVSGKMGRNP